MSVDALLRIIAGRDTAGLFEVRCRSPKSGRITAREWFDVTDRAACVQFMESKAHRLDVFVGVAPRIRREGGKSAIRHSWLLYLDCDTPEAVGRVQAFTPQPALVVQSGTPGRCHAYWSLSESIPPAWFERANRRLAHHLGADMAATDAARILRPPGTLNHKTQPPAPVTVISFQDSKTTVTDAVKNLPDPPSFRPLVKSRRRPDVDSEDPLLGISADHYYTALTGRLVTIGNQVCPFHGDGKERNPSMRLYENTWHCFAGCGGGGIFQFAALLWGYALPVRGADFHEIRRRLTDAI